MPEKGILMGKERGQTVLVVDGGGRGSALVDKYSESPYVARVLAVPGNDLMKVGALKPIETFPALKTVSVSEIIKICLREKVDLVDVAQDNAVEAGLVSRLQYYNGISVVGPTRAAGEIEWNKAWAREFGQRYELPQPHFKICLSQDEGIQYLSSQPDQPWFVKASGLAEGKGALPAKNRQEAVERVSEISRFGKAGEVFLIEKWLQSKDGTPAEEFSTYVFSDGENYKLVGSAQDHKRVYDNDKGENTGGMGCSSPPLALTTELMKSIEKKILARTLKGLSFEGRSYKGVLYLGGIVIESEPYVIEFNARWGDPEAQVVLPSLVNDLFEVSMAIVEGRLGSIDFENDGKARVVVAGASRGYPGDYNHVRGKRIYGLDEVRKIKGIRLYGAGVKVEDGKYYVAGGRLFYIVGEGKTVIEARSRAYEAMSRVSIEGNNLHYRTDIGWRDVERLRAGNA